MTKKIVSALILVVMLISLVPAAAFAANTTDTDYFVLTVSDAFGYIPARSKQNSTPIFAKITNLSQNQSVKARVEGAASAVGPFYSCTLSNNADSEYVTLYLNTKHSIRNMVNERGYYVARLGFKNNSGLSGEGVTGWWSPDSSMTHTVATRDN